MDCSDKGKLMKNKKIILLVLLILLFALFLRTFGMEKSPPSLNWDEASIGYNGFSIMHTGKDEYGMSFPLVIRSFDDYKSAIPSYLTIPLIALFGLNGISIRMISVLAGLLSVILIFFITEKLFHSKVTSIFSTFFMAISPFMVHISRILFESNIALTFFLAGFLLFLNRYKKLYLYLSIIFFALSLYTYHSYKALVPLFLITAFVSTFKKIKLNKDTFKLALFIVVLSVPIVIQTLLGNSLARFSTTSIFSLWPSPVARGFSDSHLVPFYLDFFIHNNFFYFLWELAGRYLAYFSPTNLFILEAIEPSLRVPYLSVFYPFTFVFWVIGFIYIFKNAKQFKELIFIILLSPIPAAITWNWFYPLRVLPLFAAFTILMGIGAKIFAEWFVNLKKLKISKSIKTSIIFLTILTLGIWDSFYLLDSLIVIIPSKYYGDWQPGFKESIPVIASLWDNYDQVIIESPQAQPYIFTLFYSAYSPSKYLREADFSKISQSPRNYYDFGKVKFRRIYWPRDRNLGKTLFMGTTSSLPEADIKSTPGAKLVKDIYDKSGNVSVRIVAIN